VSTGGSGTNKRLMGLVVSFAFIIFLALYFLLSQQGAHKKFPVLKDVI